MAVQAQYPSNVLFLNRNVQEGKNDYSLQQQQQQQQTDGYLNQSHMLFNNGGSNNNTATTNSRKRGRDLSSATPINSFNLSLQPQHHHHHQSQLVDLSLLHSNQHQNVVSTGLRLSFGDQQQQQQQLQQQQQQQQQQQSVYNHSSSSSSSSLLLSLLSDDVAIEIKQQRNEIDQFLQAQGEQLRRTLSDKRQKHYRALLGAAEESVSRKLREREAEADKAARRNAELEARAAQLSVEAQVWQAKARAQEATAASLQAQLHQVIMSGGCATEHHHHDGMTFSAAGDVDGCAGGQAEDAESAYVDPERVVSGCGPVCKVCRKRVASVVLLPCRHLCVCIECDGHGMIQACPLCLTIRSSSVEVFLS